MQEYMDLLGYRAKDKVTGFEGVVASISFGLYGRVQVVLKPSVDKDGKIPDSQWFDAKRLTKIGKAPVIYPQPFTTMSAGQERGPTEKPAPTRF